METMTKIRTYEVTLRRRRTIRVAEATVSNERAASRAALAWYRDVLPAGESVLCIGVDGRNAIVGIVEIARGGLHGAAVVPADVFRAAFAMGASAVVLAHNHPSEDPTPSPEDLHMTRALVSCGELLGIPVLDHLTVAVRSGETRSCMGDR
ncbi:MAG: hypothetical protein AMXMBFR56_65720 [Polyangiaceae bacterium]